ncbi:hypothetical protein H5T52_09795 [Candidatus Bipolaricaulota bacterium]|nr:hypothetical protein [Candidatus Bipolaricaulota bacterium]
MAILHVIGLPGAGKTTLTLRLGPHLGWEVLRIGQFRRRFPPTTEGEADAWLALYQELSRHGWDRVILETTGLNGRLCFLYQTLPPGRILTLKLVCSKEELLRRVKLKCPEEKTEPWVYQDTLPDRETFIEQFFERFAALPAEIQLDTTCLTPEEVFTSVVERLKATPGIS